MKAPVKNKSAKKMQVGGLVANAPQRPNLTQAAKQAAAQPLSAEQRRVKAMQDATNASMASYFKRFGQPTDEASARKAQEYQAGLPWAKQLQQMEFRKAQQAQQAQQKTRQANENSLLARAANSVRGTVKNKRLSAEQMANAQYQQAMAEQQMQQRRMGMAKGGMTKGYAKGGMANCGASMKPNGAARGK